MNSSSDLHTRLFKASLLATLPLTAHAAQMENHFDDRPQVTGSLVTLTAHTSSATVEVDEPNLTHNQNRTVWAEWIAPVNGRVTIDTLGTVFNAPMVTVHAGDHFDNLTCVAHGVDPSGPTPASVGFPVTAGTIYQIRLSSQYTSSHGEGTVNIRLTPAATPASFAGSDHFDRRPVMTGSKAYGVAGNHFSTVDAYELESFGYGDRTVWWEWTAPATGTVTMDTLESDFNTVVTVYAGDTDELSPFDGLGPVCGNNDIPNSDRSRLSFQTQAGRTYQIAVDGYYSSSKGNVVLKLDLVANTNPAGIPGADSFAHRGLLNGSRAAGVASNGKFEMEAFEPQSLGYRDGTAWWQWTAPADGTMVLDTFGSNFNTALTVHRGTNLESLVTVASNDNVTGAEWSKVIFTAKKGTTYQFVADGYYSSSYGNITLNLNPTPAPEISLQQPAGTELADDRTRKSFGTVKTGAKGVVKTFTIRNAGSAPLTGLGISRGGAHGSDFTVGPLATTTLAPGASTTFKVTFSPKATGTRTASLAIRSNDADENPFGIILTGMGARR
jgi:Abnormal spindle-like microcephaly-assoc'd, ASPM-SPD-2-Hydin